MEILGKYFWIMFFVVFFINAGIFWHRAQKVIEERPEKEQVYRKLIKGFLIWMNIPWVIMGAGILLGNVPSMFHYFKPRDGNPWVLAFWGCVVVLWLLTIYWIFFKNGAKTLVEHPGFFNVNFKEPWKIKAIIILSIAGGCFALLIFFTQDIPLPNIK